MKSFWNLQKTNTTVILLKIARFISRVSRRTLLWNSGPGPLNLKLTGLIDRMAVVEEDACQRYRQLYGSGLEYWFCHLIAYVTLVLHP